MTRIWEAARAYIRLATIAASGVAASTLMPLDAYKEVSQELIALFGLMMAAVLPTMVLTASALRAGNLSVKKLTEYRDALRAQLLVWIGLFLVSLFASVLVIIGKMVDWSVPITLPGLADNGLSVSVDLVAFINAAITMAFVLIIVRVVSVGNGILSLLRLSSEIAITEAQMRDETRMREVEKEIDGIPERKGYGDYVDLKH